MLATAFAATTCSLSDLIDPASPGTLTIEPLFYLDSAFVGSTARRDVGIPVGGGVAADPLPFTVRSLHNSAWLKLSAGTGAAPDTFVVQLDPAGLAAGTYQDTLEFALAGPGAPPVRVPVEFRVVGCAVTAGLVNGNTTGALSNADCGAPNKNGSFAALFSFTGTANDSITIRLNSTFDGYLVLDTVLGATPFIENDNCAPGTTNPCLVYLRLPRTGTYFVEVTSATPGSTGTFSLDLARPRPPTGPANPLQLMADLVTTVAVGAAVDVASINLRGTVNDPDNDNTRLEIEIRPVGTAFTNAASYASGPVAAGNAATVAIAGLSDDVSYHWQARAVDATGRAGPWGAFGGNAESAADFRVSIPQAPAVPAGAVQLRTDGSTGVALGGTTDESSVLFQATVTDRTRRTSCGSKSR